MPPPPPSHSSDLYPAMRRHRSSTLRVVIAAQWLAVTGFAAFLVFAGLLFARGEVNPESIAALIFEQIAGLLPPIIALCALHLAVAVGLMRGPRPGIVLHAVMSGVYVAGALVALASAKGRSAEAQQSVVTLVTILLITLTIFNVLAFVNWRHAR